MFTFKEKSISSTAAFRVARLHIKPGSTGTAHHLHPSAVVLWWSSGSTRTAQPGSAYGTFPGGRRSRWNPPAAPLSSSPRPPAIRRPRTVTAGESANADQLETIPPHSEGNVNRAAFSPRDVLLLLATAMQPRVATKASKWTESKTF